MESMELNMKQLESVVGGVADSPEAQAAVEALVKAYKELGYDRNQFIGELMKNQVEPEYFNVYLECWDSLKY